MTRPLEALRGLPGGPVVRKGHLAGSHRTVPPETTVARVKASMAAMGITRIADVTDLDRIGVPVVMVCRPNARSVAVSQGKGLDIAAATASGLMEAVEVHHAEHIHLPLKLASVNELAPDHRLIDVARLPRVAGGRFHRDLAMLWIEGYDLLGEAPLWLPFEMVRANFTLPAPPGSGCFDASTNGLASGNHMLEAVCHGICEVVERDATSLWNRLPPAVRRRTRVDPDTVDDAACRDVLAKLAEADFAVAIWEMTGDVGAPAFCSAITDRRDETAHLGVGWGCHPARGIALLRALTEAVQVRTTYISGARDDLMPEDYDDTAVAERRAWADRLMHTPDGWRDFRDAPDRPAETLNEDVAWLLDRLRAVGITQVAAVNLTRADVGIPVVRTVIPGLEGPDDHPDYVPGARASGKAP